MKNCAASDNLRPEHSRHTEERNRNLESTTDELRVVSYKYLVEFCRSRQGHKGDY